MKKIISFILRRIPRTILQRYAHIFLRILSLFYRGNNVTCPISGKSYRKFLPYGRRNPRPNALCPDSLSLERHRLLWLYLMDETDFFEKTHKFLHIAPELCFISKFKKMANIEYVTADLNSPLADVKLDVQKMPFDDNSFDVIMCNHVLEHVDDDQQAMKEIYRVMSHGGWGIFQVPFYPPVPETTVEDPLVTDPKEREKLFGQDDHVRKYGLDYPERLRKAGFIVKEDDYAGKLDPKTIKKYALPENEIIYFCRKE